MRYINLRFTYFLTYFMLLLQMLTTGYLATVYTCDWQYRPDMITYIQCHSAVLRDPSLAVRVR